MNLNKIGNYTEGGLFVRRGLRFVGDPSLRLKNGCAPDDAKMFGMFEDRSDL